MYLPISKMLEAFYFLIIILYDVNRILYWMNKNTNGFIKYKYGKIKIGIFENDIHKS